MMEKDAPARATCRRDLEVTISPQDVGARALSAGATSVQEIVTSKLGSDGALVGAWRKPGFGAACDPVIGAGSSVE